MAHTGAWLPGVSMLRPFVEAGGTLTYGPDMPAMEKRCAVIVAKILAGAKPGEVAVERPVKFELIINLEAMKALGLKVSHSVLMGADHVIK